MYLDLKIPKHLRDEFWWLIEEVERNGGDPSTSIIESLIIEVNKMKTGDIERYEKESKLYLDKYLGAKKFGDRGDELR